VVPARVPVLNVIVKAALTVDSAPLSTVIPVTETWTATPGAAVVGLKVRVRAVRLNPLDLPTNEVLSVAVMVYESLVRPAEDSSVSMRVVWLHAPALSMVMVTPPLRSADPLPEIVEIEPSLLNPVPLIVID
jgi:hypothetical protein